MNYEAQLNLQFAVLPLPAVKIALLAIVDVLEGISIPLNAVVGALRMAHCVQNTLTFVW